MSTTLPRPPARPFRSALALTLALAPAALAQPFTYRYDDGSANVNNGPNFPAEFMWGQVFSPQPQGRFITSIDVAYGRIPDGTPATVWLFADPTPDNNPGDAVLLWNGPTQVANNRTNIFNRVPTPPIEITGDFFVAVSCQVDGTSNNLPARIDPRPAGHPDLVRAWFFGATDIDPSNLGSSPYVLPMTSNAILGVFMIRAVAEPTCPCPADFNRSGGIPDIDDIVAFFDAFNLGSPFADADCSAGVPTLDDVITFLDAFSVGCPS